MAFKRTFGGPTEGMVGLYDLHNQVGQVPGKGAAANNGRSDLIVVQYLLIGAYRGGVAPLGAPMTADGAFGRQTHYWLLYFRGDCEQALGAKLVDPPGVVLPFGNAVSRSSMIFQLNKRFRAANPGVGSGLGFDSTDPKMPLNIKKVFADIGEF